MKKFKSLDVYCSYGEYGIEGYSERKGESLEEVLREEEREVLRENGEGELIGGIIYGEEGKCGSIGMGEEMVRVILEEGCSVYDIVKKDGEGMSEEDWKKWEDFMNNLW